jgi:hypothetical protein
MQHSVFSLFTSCHLTAAGAISILWCTKSTRSSAAAAAPLSSTCSMRLDLRSCCIAVPSQRDTRGRHFGEVEAETEAKAGQRENPEGRKRIDRRQKRKIVRNTTQSTHGSSSGCARVCYSLKPRRLYKYRRLLSLRFAVLCDITLVVLCQCITPCGSPLALPCPSSVCRCPLA